MTPCCIGWDVTQPRASRNREHSSQRSRQYELVISPFVFSDFRYTEETPFFSRHILHDSRDVRKLLCSIFSEKILATIQRGERATTRFDFFHGFNEAEELFHSRHQDVHLRQAAWVRSHGSELVAQIVNHPPGLLDKMTSLIFLYTCTFFFEVSSIRYSSLN